MTDKVLMEDMSWLEIKQAMDAGKDTPLSGGAQGRVRPRRASSEA